MIGSAISAAMNVISAAKIEQEYLNTLNDDEKKIYLDKKAKLWEEEEAHRRAIEIANASRPRNFWGK